MRLFVLASVLALLQFTLVECQLQDSVNSETFANSAVDAVTDGADDSNSVVFNPADISSTSAELTPDFVPVANVDASNDGNNPTVIASTGNAVARCGSNKGQADDRVHARDINDACSAEEELPSTQLPSIQSPPPQSYQFKNSVPVKKIRQGVGRFLQNLGESIIPKAGPEEEFHSVPPKNQGNRGRLNCPAPYIYEMCCDGPLGLIGVRAHDPTVTLNEYSFNGRDIVEDIQSCEASTS